MKSTQQEKLNLCKSFVLQAVSEELTIDKQNGARHRIENTPQLISNSSFQFIILLTVFCKTSKKINNRTHVSGCGQNSFIVQN